MADPLVLVLGGTRSGKSRFGLDRIRALAHDRTVSVVVTALPGDAELDARIERHRRARPPDWPTIDAGEDLGATISTLPRTTPVLVEGFMLWLSAIAGDAADVDAVLDGPVLAATQALAAHRAPVVIVSDELGLGLVPLDPGARAFRDLVGLAHQRLASVSDEVHFLVAGLPMTLKSAAR